MRTMLAAFVGGIIGTVFTSMLVLAWAGPTSAPPNGNVSAPINVGIVDQIKNGGLGLNSLAVFGNGFYSGASRYINFGTTTASGSSGYGIRDNNGVMEYRNAGGSWTPLSSGGSSGSGTSFTISSDAQNVNLYVIAGSPATAGTYTITINAGVTVGSSNTATPALISGTWPAGSIVTLINNGNIYGRGGDGGAGGSGAAGGAGGAGGAAMSLGYDIAINNTNGNIFGGGGGGGGGDGSSSCQFVCNSVGGNGGGGGQGSAGGSGGAAGYGSHESGGGGGSGSVSGPGAGSTYIGVFHHMAGANGGAWASTGGTSSSGRAGGAGGAAINRNGKTITWLGGNNSTQVKGAVQ
jgi:hypothetical protein